MSDVGVDTGPSNVSLYPPTGIFTPFVSLFWGRILQMMQQYLTLAPCGNLFLCIKKNSTLDVSNASEEASNLFGHAVSPFLFIGSFNEVTLFL